MGYDGRFGIAARLEQVSDRFNLMPVDVTAYDYDCEVIELLPKELCLQHQFFPVNIGEDEGHPVLILAMIDPWDVEAIMKATEVSGRRIELCVTLPDLLAAAIRRWYP